MACPAEASFALPDQGGMTMIVRQRPQLAGMAFILCAAPAHAGPCTDRIYQTDLDVAKILDSAAAEGRPAPNRHSRPCIASRPRDLSPAPNNKPAISRAEKSRRSPKPWMRRATPTTQTTAQVARRPWPKSTACSSARARRVWPCARPGQTIQP